MQLKRSLFLFAAVIALQASYSAAYGDDNFVRTEIKRTEDSGAPGMEIIQSFLEVKPGGEIPLHIHHGTETIYVIQGATLQTSDGKTMDLPTGSTNMVMREVAHGGAKVSGDSLLKIYSVFVVDKGKPLAEPAKPTPNPNIQKSKETQ